MEITTNKTDKFNANNKERTVTAKIYYFGSNADRENEIELLDIQDVLENAFLEDLKVSDTFYIPINNGIQIDVINNDYLIATLEDLYTIEEIEDTGTEPYMDTLEINLTDN